MRLRPFFTFYGGKHRTARLYPAPEHGAVIEPFAGSAGYATRHHDRAATLGEKDETIAALWLYLTQGRGLVVACEQVGATWRPFEPFVMAKANESASGGKRSPEAIYVQGSRLIGINTQQVAA